MRSAELRAKTEADFHNSAYEGKVRKTASSFYELMDNCSRYYRQFLKVHCAGKRVLEYGCGENSVAPFLLNNGVSSYVGIDISSVAVDEAEKSREGGGHPVDRVKYHVMNAEALEFEDNSFDLICGVAILHHLDLEKAYSEIARTLRPGGAAIFLEPLAYNPFINLYRRLTPHLRTPDEHPFLMRDIKMAESSFGGVETRFYNLFTLLSLVSSRTSLFPVLRRGLDRVDRGVFNCCPPLRRYAWTVSLVLTSPLKSASPRVFVGKAGSPTEL
jgi:SAM-dependent methyltransferase